MLNFIPPFLPSLPLIFPLLGWSAALKPLADLIVQKYKAFLPSLVYPQRTGEHPNTAFGLIFALEYARCEGENIYLEDREA